MRTLLERDGKSLNFWITGQGRPVWLKLHHELQRSIHCQLFILVFPFESPVPGLNSHQSSWDTYPPVKIFYFLNLSSSLSSMFSHPPWSWLVVSKLPSNMPAPKPIPTSEQHTLGRRESTFSRGTSRKQKSLFQPWVPDCLCTPELALNLQ